MTQRKGNFGSEIRHRLSQQWILKKTGHKYIQGLITGTCVVRKQGKEEVSGNLECESVSDWMYSACRNVSHAIRVPFILSEFQVIGPRL